MPVPLEMPEDGGGGSPWDLYNILRTDVSMTKCGKLVFFRGVLPWLTPFAIGSRPLRGWLGFIASQSPSPVIASLPIRTGPWIMSIHHDEATVTLQSMFPDCDIVRSPLEGVCDSWNHLLSITAAEGALYLLRLLGLSTSSTLYRQLRLFDDRAVAVPRQDGIRRRAEFYDLVFQVEHDLAMRFYPPQKEDRIEGAGPEQFVAFTGELGRCCFNQFSGMILSPRGMLETESEIASTFDVPPETRIHPFYDHETGDYDCWVDDDWNLVWTFDHERGRVEQRFVGDFGAWFDASLRMQLEVHKRIREQRMRADDR